MNNRENLITYLCMQQASAFEEALQLGDPDPSHFAMDAVLQELETQFGLRVPHRGTVTT